MGPWLLELKRQPQTKVPNVTQEQLDGVDDWTVNTLVSSQYPGDDKARAEWIARRWKAARGE